MQTTIFTVYDDKAEAYLPPFFLNTVGEALRAFSELANDPNHAFCKYPSDFTLFQIGTFDNGNCSFELLPTPTAIGKAIEYKTPRQPEAGRFDPDSQADQKGSV